MVAPPTFDYSAPAVPVLTWFDFVLTPGLFSEHMAKLKKNPKEAPSALDMIKMFIKPIISITNMEQRQNERCKRLEKLISSLVLSLSISIPALEKVLTLEQQEIVLLSLISSSDPLAAILQHRWILKKHHVTPTPNIMESVSYITEAQEKLQLSETVKTELLYEIGQYYFAQHNFLQAFDFFQKSEFSFQKLSTEEQAQSVVNQNNLQTFLISCQSIKGEFKEEKVANKDSFILQAEKAKWSKNAAALVPLLLHDITDPYISNENIPLAYRLSLPTFFEAMEAKKVLHCCNCIYVTLHQLSEHVEILNELDVSDKEICLFLFQKCSAIAGVEENPLYNNRLKNWLLGICHMQDSLALWELFVSHGKSFLPLSSEDQKKVHSLSIVAEKRQNNEKIQRNISSILLPLKRHYEDPIHTNDTIKVSRAYKYFKMVWNGYSSEVATINFAKQENFPRATAFFGVLGTNGKYGVLACRIKQNELKSPKELVDKLLGLIREKLLPSPPFLEFFISCLLDSGEFNALVDICREFDQLRREKQQSSQDGSLSLTGTLCDFTVDLCSFSSFLFAKDLAERPPIDLAKVALSMIAHFWKPYLATKMEFIADSGLLHCIQSASLLSNMLSAIMALLHVNNKQRDAQYEEKSMPCPEHYHRFALFQAGFLECWNITDQRFSAQLSGDGANILNKIAKAITESLIAKQPNESLFQLQQADILFNEGNHRRALRCYLQAGAAQTAFFADSLSPFSFCGNALRRMVHCLHSIQAMAQAIVLSQLLPMGDCAGIYRLIQNNPQTLNPHYFQYLWKIPVLEMLVHVYRKANDLATTDQLVALIQKPELNQNNLPATMQNTQKILVATFYKALYRDLILFT